MPDRYITLKEHRKNDRGAYRIRKWSYTFLFFVVLGWAFYETGFNPILFKDLGNSIKFVIEMFPPDYSVFRVALYEVLITLYIAIIGTFLSVVISIPVSYLAASNTAPNQMLYHISRTTLSFLRGIPEIVFALIFVPTLSLGPFAGVMALTIHNIGVKGKIFSELIEASEIGPKEAIQSTGAGQTLIYFFGILPQILPNVISNIFYRFEVNVRASIILGLVGAGGIGQQLIIHFKMFQYDKVLVDIFVIMVLVVSIDYFGGYLRRKII